MDSLIELDTKITTIKRLLDYTQSYLSIANVFFYKEQSIKRPWYYRKTVINFVLIFTLIREFLSLLMKDTHLSLYLGDFAYNWQVKTVTNMVFISGCLSCINLRIINFYYSKLGIYPMKFIQFTEDLPDLSYKYRIVTNCMKIFWIKFIPSVVFILYFTSFSLGSSKFQLMTIGIFWSLFASLFLLYGITNQSLQIIYFYLKSTLIKLKLRLENKRFEYMISKPLNRSSSDFFLMSSAKSLFDIHSEIKFQNDFWSKFVFIEMIMVIMVASTSVNVVVFAQMNLFIKILLRSALGFSSSFNFLFCISCVSLNNESNQSFRALLPMSSKRLNTRLSLRTRFKV